MRKLLALATLSMLALTGCVVHSHHHHNPAPPPRPAPPPPAPVTVVYTWNDHRYAVWREYYACTPEEVYWLEGCGYDDDDILVALTISRRARVSVRTVFYEYDRCGRSLFTVAAVFRVPMGVFFCREVPVNYGCPPAYARCYGYYWRNEHHYYTNAEFHSLIQLQVGIRYYGYSHANYFRDYDACVARNDRAPFRTIVVKDHHRAGSGGRDCDDKPIVKCPKPWDKPDRKDWDRAREQERKQEQVRHTPDRERQELERIKREAERDDRRRAHEEAKAAAERGRQEREEKDKRMPPGQVRRDQNPGNAEKNDPPGQDRREANPAGPERRPENPPDRRAGPANPDVKRPADPERRVPPGQERRAAPAEPPREEPRNAPPPARKGPERRVEEPPKAPPPPAKKPAEEAPKNPPPAEQKKSPPPPPQNNNKGGSNENKGGSEKNNKGNDKDDENKGGDNKGKGKNSIKK